MSLVKRHFSTAQRHNLFHKRLRALRQSNSCDTVDEIENSSSVGVPLNLAVGDIVDIRGVEYHNSLKVPFQVQVLKGRGAGLVAAVDLPKGTEVYSEADVLEEVFSPEDIEALFRSLPNLASRSAVLMHSWAQDDDTTGEGRFMWTLDTVALFNHSSTPNSELVGGNVGM